MNKKTLALPRIIPLCFMLLIVLAPCAHAQAPQPGLELNRTVVNWPYVQIYYESTYGALVTTKWLTENNFRVYENGEEIKDFTVECITGRGPVSVALVLDGSWQTYGWPGYQGRLGGDRFLAVLDSLVDEVAVIGYRDTVVLLQPFTVDFPAVRIAMDSVLQRSAPWSWWKDGGVWDAVMMGCEELAQNAKNPVKVIMLYSVEDSFPCQTWRTNCLSFANLVIPFAQQHDIRCIVFPNNTYVKPIAQFDSLATLTGGKMYVGGSYGGYYAGDEIPPVLEQIAKDIVAGFEECKIVYKSECPDGTKREVRVEMTYP